MTLDPRAKELLDTLAKIGFPKIGSLPAREMRGFLTQMEAGIPPGPVLHHVEDKSIPGSHGEVPVRVYRPTGAPTAILVYFHGGGWTLGSLNGVDAVLRSLALRANATIVSVDYRLAPEHIFPAAIDDAFAATTWAFSQRAELARPNAPLFVGGDSAGGNLSAVVSQIARDAGTPTISGAVLIYPCVDGDIDAPALRKFDAPILTLDEIAWFYDQYVPSREQRTDPRFAPIRTPNLADLPPALILTAEYDLLRDEDERYAKRLEDTGCEVTLINYAGMIHGFFTLGDLAQAVKAREDITTFLERIGTGKIAPRI